MRISHARVVSVVLACIAAGGCSTPATSTVQITQIDSLGIADLAVDVSRLPPGWLKEHRRVRGRAGPEYHVTLKQGNAVKVVLVPRDEDVTPEVTR